jgi:hypothetical protein
VKLKTRKAHVWANVEGVVWKLTLDSSGALTLRQKSKHHQVTLQALELVRKARQLREGSLCL